VALETGTRNRRAIRKRLLEETAVVCVYGVCGHPVPGIIAGTRVCFTVAGQAGENGRQYHRKQLAHGIAGLAYWKIEHFLFL